MAPTIAANYTSILDMLWSCCTCNTAIVVGILAVIVVLLYLSRRKIENHSWGMLGFSFIVFLSGVAIYTVGALQSDDMGLCDAIYTIPSGIISSLGMFVFQDDISELSEHAKHCSEFMAA